MDSYKRLVKLVSHNINEMLLVESKSDDERKKTVLNEIYDLLKDDIDALVLLSPGRLIEIISHIRNPKIQYEIMSQNMWALLGFINELPDEEFLLKFKNYFYYPTSVEDNLDSFYESWISYNKIHVKIGKQVLGNKYELLKNELRGKPFINREDSVKSGGIDFSQFQ